MRTIQRGLACALLCLLASASGFGQDGNVWATKKSGW
ncbi:MAG: hypothetical protein V7641_1014 [Blastocatellia bacterium]